MIDTADRRLALSEGAPLAVRQPPPSRAALLLAVGLALAELAALAGIVLVGIAREGITPGAPEALLAAGFGAAFVLLLQQTGGYRFARLRQPERMLPQLFGLGALGVAAGMAIIGRHAGMLLPATPPLLLAVGSFCLAVAGLRFALASAVLQAEAKGGLHRRVAVIALGGGGGGGGGDAADLERLRQRLELERGQRCALLVVDGEPGLEGWPGSAVDAARWAEEIVVVAAQPAAAGGAIEQLLDALEVVPVEVAVAIACEPAPSGFALSRVHAAPMGQADRALKRGCDLVIASAALLFLAPLMLLVAALIKLDSPGPVLFRQVRRGYNNQSFQALKFRSLRHEMADPLADRLVTRDDPRVTRIGAFLRRSSIDELPQLLNVLGGDMSLVGPRPHPLNAKAGGRPYEEVVERFQRRYRVRPGITGWAQVNGLRGNTETEDDLRRRVALDLEYIRHWSLWLDLWILAKTPIATFKGENAC